MKKDCCVVVTHLHQEEMVVDPNNYDVSELRKQARADDTSDSEGDDHGFNWVTDQESDQEHDADDETDAFLLKNQWQSPVDDEQQSGQGSQQSARKDQQSTWENRQQHSQESTDRDDHDISKFFTSQDGGRILSRQRTDGNDNRRTTTLDSHTTEESDSMANGADEENGGEWGRESEDERKEEWGKEGNGVNEGSEENGEKGGRGNGVNEGSGESRDEEESRRQRLERLGVDPINYDLGELRTVTDQKSDSFELNTEAHGFVWSEPPEQYRTRIEDPTAEQHRRLLTVAGIDPELVGDKPYLTTLPTEAAGSLVIDWLEFLTGEAGTKGAIDALARYQEIGWFTARVEDELKNSMQWIDNSDGDGFCVFDRGDHLLSFAYVAKIASVNSEGIVFY
jgi:archaellum component FlaD/FlaE